MKQGKWGKIFNLAVILLSLGMVLAITFNNPELSNAWDVLFTLDLRYLALAVACYAGYVLAEGTGLFAFLRMAGFRVKLLSAAHFSFAGMFYANITPSASGGQPMQIYLMAKRGVSAGVATSAMTARYFFNQLMVVLIAVILWLANGEFVSAQLGHLTGLIVLGCVVNFVSVPLIIAVLLNRRMVERLALWIIRFLAKHRLCKKPDVWTTRAQETIAKFHTSLMDLVRRPGHLLVQVLVSTVEMTLLMLVPLLVYKALGLSGTPWYHLLTVSFLLFVSASYTPLPGASGAQEGGFLAYFNGLIPAGTISVALLVWRFVTYYLCLLLGCADVVITGLRKRRNPIAQDGDSTVTDPERKAA